MQFTCAEGKTGDEGVANCDTLKKKKKMGSNMTEC